jgi:hypothetical protein
MKYMIANFSCAWNASLAAAAWLLTAQATTMAAETVWQSPVSQIIDEEIGAALRAKQIAPATAADDVELLRRVYLDVLGRVPTRDEALAYLNDSASDRPHRLIEQLLKHEEMPAYWSLVLDDWLNSSALEREFGRDGFLEYLREALAANKPWNQLARELLAADPKNENERAAAYFLAVRLRSGDNAEKLDSLTSAVATGLFGVQLQCAKCHDHPFVDDLRQDHYYGLAAFLGRTQEARLKDMPIVKERADGEVSFITTAQEQKTARLMFLDGQVLEEPPPPEDRNAWYSKGEGGLPDAPYFSRRQALADHALSAESPYFKRAIVNRLWKQLIGRGLVEPVDQMHAANAPTHPQLLARLADDFATQGFDLRRLVSGILHSQTYLRSSRWSESEPRPLDAEYAVGLLRPLTPEQMAVSVGIATGHYDQAHAKLQRDKQNRKIETVTPANYRVFYHRQREVQEFAARFRNQSETFEASTTQALFLSYNPLATQQLEPSQGNLVQRLAQQADMAQTVQEAYVCVLSRRPSDEEVTRVVEFLEVQQSSKQDLCRELVWALLYSAEFRFNH